MNDTITTNELVQLGVADPVFFLRTMFPNTFRSRTPAFHRDIIDALEDPAKRHVAIEVFRGGAKTSLLRAMTARRIAYGLSRTILFISRSQEYAIESCIWLQRQITNNHTYSSAFALTPGTKWTSENLSINHGVFGHTVRVIARGITGQNRGTNIEDYRPDLIVVDDADDEETTNTPEARRKTSQLFFGAIEKSLARPSDAPTAKIVLLQTPLHREDLVETCLRDPQWHGLRYGCFDEAGRSRWPEMFSDEDLLKEKDSHIRRNQLSLWMREMECRVIADELSYFRPEWLTQYTTTPEHMNIVLAIDPAPPLSDKALEKNLDTDYQAFAVVGFHKGRIYVLELVSVRNQNPEETAAEFFRLASKWNPRQVVVESVAYQRSLAHYLREKMRSQGRYYVVQEFADKRKKADRIRQALAGPASSGNLLVRDHMTEFVQQFADYPNVKHDDLLDAVSIAVTAVGTRVADDPTALEAEFRRISEEERQLPDLPRGGWAV